MLFQVIGLLALVPVEYLIYSFFKSCPGIPPPRADQSGNVPNWIIYE